mmetsp:Transcript_52764/g.123404  ORF Transcript_52764/g.123404 Transcript_52764/m.123404 type:complete len:293 (+) Transcript_52764:71-949(+)
MGVGTSCLAPPHAHAFGGSQVPSTPMACGVTCVAPSCTCPGNADARSMSSKSSGQRLARHVTLESRDGLPWTFSNPSAHSCCSVEALHIGGHFETAEAAIAAARKQVKEGHVQDAFHSYLAALQLSEDSGALYNEVGRFMLSNGQLNGAESLFNKALDADPTNPEYRYRLGVVLQQKGRTQEAAEAFAQSLRQNPRFVGALFNLGIVHRELGDHRSAAEDFRRILQIEAKNHSALTLLGECLAEAGDLPGAVSALEEALRLDPSNRSTQKDLQRMRNMQNEARAVRKASQCR